MLNEAQAQCSRCKSLDYFESMLLLDFFVVDAENFVGKLLICRGCRQLLLDWIETSMISRMVCDPLNKSLIVNVSSG